MKKWLLIISSVILLVGLAACNKDSKAADGKDSKKLVTLKVGASSVPHAEILEYLAKDIQKDGVKLDIKIIQDGVQTNQQTADGELDFNYFQHKPYLEQVNRDSGLDLVSVKGIHIEPFGVYSKKIKNIKDLPEHAKVAVPKDVVNFSRALQLFAKNNIITLNDKKSGDYTVEDIVKNDKKIKFIGVDGPLLNRSLDDVDAAAINTNYALEGGLNPTKDALIIEGSDSPYVNIIATTKERKNDPAIQTVVKWLTSEKSRKFIEKKYKGAVVPAF